MLYEILFIASFFATRVVLPILITLVIGEWLTRRVERQESRGS